MEGKIKGGGGAAVRKNLTVSHDASVNAEKSQRAQSNPKYLKVYNWAVQFPVAYWEEGTIGMGAKVDITPNKAFLFIPFHLVLSPKAAKKSEIGELFSRHPYHFSGHPEAEFDILLCYLIYEKSKGPSSKWSPYFEAISDLDLLIDWSDYDLSQLQDPLLAYHAEQLVQQVEEKYKNLSEVFEEHSDVFPSGTVLRQSFDWSFRVLRTRAVNYGELRLIPMADFLNFSNNELVFEDFDREILEQKASVLDSGVDYRDFLGSPVKGRGEETARYRSKLDRFLEKNDKQALKTVKNVWELERLIDEYESSEDEEEICIVEFEQDEAEETDEVPGEDYIVISTDEFTGVKQGGQIFNQVKVLSNRDWLLQYGIAIENNWFESYYLFLWNGLGRSGPVSVEDIKEKVFNKEFSTASLADVAELVVLKKSILNMDLLKYFRKGLNYAELALPEPKLKVSPVDVEVELKVIEVATSLLLELENRGTPLAQDLNLLHRNLPRRLKFAVIYRTEQKKILHKHVAMLQELKAILIGFKERGSLDSHLAGKTVKEVKNIYPLRKYLRSLLGNLKNN